MWDSGLQQMIPPELDEYLPALLTLVENHQLAELCLEGPGLKIELRTAAALAPAAELPIPPPARPAGPSRPKPAREASHHYYFKVRSPLLGVFYRSSSPDAPCFVEEGDYVHAGQVVGMIEAMKVFNEICAERSGRVVEICAGNGQIVEADQVLLRLDQQAPAPEAD
jgi:acetyl-CoA carboxylase biotin carboxyl carrier protein